jgi:hypothetical protein
MKFFRKPKPEPADVYQKLRPPSLQASRAELGIPAMQTETQPWGVVMDGGIASGSATVVALSDGNASIYLSSAGGSIGGGWSREAIRKAALNAVAIAAEVQSILKPVTSIPVPAADQVVFYAITDARVFSGSAFVEDPRTHRHRPSRLGHAMQEIITRYEKIQQ